MLPRDSQFSTTPFVFPLFTLGLSHALSPPFIPFATFRPPPPPRHHATMATVVVLSFYLRIREPVHLAYAAAGGCIRSGCVPQGECSRSDYHRQTRGSTRETRLTILFVTKADPRGMYRASAPVCVRIVRHPCSSPAQLFSAASPSTKGWEMKSRRSGIGDLQVPAPLLAPRPVISSECAR